MSLTEEDRKQLMDIVEDNARRFKHEIEGCTTIRERFLNGERYGKLADEHDVAKDSISYHLRDDCKCDTDVTHLLTNQKVGFVDIHCPYCDFETTTYDKLTNHLRSDHL